MFPFDLNLLVAGIPRRSPPNTPGESQISEPKMQSPFKILDEEKKEVIISLLEHNPNISAVARMIGAAPHTVYKERKKDPKFDERVKEALEIGYDGLEAEAWRRGVDGVDKPILFQGEVVSTIKEYSDSLLNTLLRANRPQKYDRGAKVNVNADEKVNLTINIGSQD